jgi:hypothetical protein
VATETNLTGVWAADDGALYYIRHLDDHSLWWAGLHVSGFHLGVRFANVFRGRVIPRDGTIVGAWADVPRGENRGSGELSLEILKVGSAPGDGEPFPGQAPSDDTFPPKGKPSAGPGPRLELRRSPRGTTGGFGAARWRQWSVGDPFDITYRFDHVYRYDGLFRESNTALRDFAVVCGEIADTDIPHVSWYDPIPRNYCTFVGGDTKGLDGDLNFNVMNPSLDSAFWDEGWLPSPFGAGDPLHGLSLSELAHRHWEANGKEFHTETVMFGRTNSKNDCAAEPDVLLPGWMEAEGNSVLFNGRPVYGQVYRVPAAADPEVLEVYVLGRELQPRMPVRVTGVLNLDSHAIGGDEWALLQGETPAYRSALEVHPVYAIDVLQDFQRPRPGADLTGVWHGEDVGTYYVRQLGGNAVWWLGLSRDQGQTFANVFHGFIRYQDDEGVPLAVPVLVGDWVDVPMGVNGNRGSGRLRLTGGSANWVPTATVLSAVEKTGGFGASTWTKLYDRPSSSTSPSSSPTSGRSRLWGALTRFRVGRRLVRPSR